MCVWTWSQLYVEGIGSHLSLVICRVWGKDLPLSDSSPTGKPQGLNFPLEKETKYCLFWSPSQKYRELDGEGHQYIKVETVIRDLLGRGLSN